MAQKEPFQCYLLVAPPLEWKIKTHLVSDTAKRVVGAQYTAYITQRNKIN